MTGDISEREFLDRAGKVESSKEHPFLNKKCLAEQMAEAHYCIQGEMALIDGDSAKARIHYEICIAADRLN